MKIERYGSTYFICSSFSLFSSSKQFLKMLSTSELEQLLATIPGGYKSSSNFFANEKLKQQIAHKKLGVITNYANEHDPGELDDSTEIYCNAPNCSLTFAGVAAYQTHFNSVHRYLCNECRRSLPTAHLLDLHLSEQHDCYFAMSVERGIPMFACFVQECKEKSMTAKERKDHCINVHKFPANYRFDQVSDKLKGDNVNVESQVHKGMSKPVETTRNKQFSFGHSKEKAFIMKKAQKTGKPRAQTAEKMEMDELQAALDNVL